MTIPCREPREPATGGRPARPVRPRAAGGDFRRPDVAALLALQRLAGNRAVVQRKFGFEFQSGDNRFVASHGVAAVGEKEEAWADDEGQVSLEGDSADRTGSDLEFITTATDDVRAAVRAVDKARGLAHGLATTGSGIYRKGSRTGSGTWTRDTGVQVGNPDFPATMQATVGVPLEALPALLANMLALAPEYGSRIRQATVPPPEQFLLKSIVEDTDRAIGKEKVSPAVRGLLTFVQYYIEAAEDRPVDVKEVSASAFESTRQVAPAPDVRVLMSTANGRAYKVKGTTDGPKTLFDLMHRTNLREAYASLDADDRKAFRALATNLAKDPRYEKTKIPTPPYLGDRDLLDRYRTDYPLLSKLAQVEELVDADGTRSMLVRDAPTVPQWVMSIVADLPVGGNTKEQRHLAGRDSMSPPLGYGRSPDPSRFPTKKEIRDNTVYGMGAYPMDTSARRHPTEPGLFVVELRGLSESLRKNFSATTRGLPTYPQWLTEAQTTINVHLYQLVGNSTQLVTVPEQLLLTAPTPPLLLTGPEPH